MLIRIRRSIYCNNFNSSNAVVCSHLILAYTVWLTIMNAVELERNSCFVLFCFFFTFIEECCVVIEKNIDRKLANRISYQIWYKGCLKGKSGRGVQICEGGSISASGFGPGGSKSASGFRPGVPNPRGVQIRCDTGIPVEKSGLKYPKPLQSLLSMNQVNLFKS